MRGNDNRDMSKSANLGMDFDRLTVPKEITNDDWIGKDKDWTSRNGKLVVVINGALGKEKSQLTKIPTNGDIKII